MGVRAAAVRSSQTGHDRKVENAAAAHRDGLYARIAANPIRPSPEARRANPRSSSAKLRWVLQQTAQD